MWRWHGNYYRISYQWSANEPASGITATNAVGLNGFCGYCITACLVNDCFDSFPPQSCCSHKVGGTNVLEWFVGRLAGWIVRWMANAMHRCNLKPSIDPISDVVLSLVILMSLELHGLYHFILEYWIWKLNDAIIRITQNARNEKYRNEVSMKQPFGFLCLLEC